MGCWPSLLAVVVVFWGLYVLSDWTGRFGWLGIVLAGSLMSLLAVACINTSLENWWFRHRLIPEAERSGVSPSLILFALFTGDRDGSNDANPLRRSLNRLLRVAFHQGIDAPLLQSDDPAWQRLDDVSQVETEQFHRVTSFFATSVRSKPDASGFASNLVMVAFCGVLLLVPPMRSWLWTPLLILAALAAIPLLSAGLDSLLTRHWYRGEFVEQARRRGIDLPMISSYQQLADARRRTGRDPVPAQLFVLFHRQAEFLKRRLAVG